MIRRRLQNVRQCSKHTVDTRDMSKDILIIQLPSFTGITPTVSPPVLGLLLDHDTKLNRARLFILLSMCTNMFIDLSIL